MDNKVGGKRSPCHAAFKADAVDSNPSVGGQVHASHTHSGGDRGTQGEGLEAYVLASGRTDEAEFVGAESVCSLISFQSLISLACHTWE